LLLQGMVPQESLFINKRRGTGAMLLPPGSLLLFLILYLLALLDWK
jgi:hypothetical protein